MGDPGAGLLISTAAALGGGVELAASVVAAGAVAARLSGRAAGDGDGPAVRVATGLLLFTTQLVAVPLVGAATDLFYAPVVTAVHVLLAAGVLAAVRPAPASSPIRLGPAPLAGVLGFAAVVAVGVGIRQLPSESDDITYHVPNAAFWVRVHDLWHLPPVLPGYFTNAYPSDSELLTAWVIQPFHDDRLAVWPTLLFGALLLAGCGLVAEQLAGRAAVGVLAGAVVVLSPISWQTQVGSALTDWAGTAGLVAAVGFVLRARSGGDRWIVLAGLAGGLSIGSKDTALLPGVMVVVFAVGLLRRWSVIPRLAAGIVALAGIWYLRDWIDTGNPLYPETVRVAGRTVWRGGVSPLTAYSTSLASDAVHGRMSVLHEWFHLGRIYVGLPAVLAATTVAGLVRRSALAATSLLSLVFFAAYLVTPYTGPAPAFLIASQLRYALPALALAAVCGCCASRWIRLFGWIALAVDVVSVWRGSGFNPAVDAGTATLVVAALAGGAAALAVLARATVAWPRSAAATVSALILIAAAVAVDAHREVPPDPVGAVLTAAGVGPHASVAVIGDTDVLGVLGPDLGRVVVNIGGGPAGEVPYGVAGLDRTLARLRPRAVVVGPAVAVGVVAGWQPPGYRLVGTAMGDRVYARPASTAAGDRNALDTTSAAR